MTFLLYGCDLFNRRYEFNSNYYYYGPSYSDWLASTDRNNGILYISGEINVFGISDTCRRVNILDSDDKIIRITIFINSNGGSADAMREFYNGINNCKKPIDIVVVGNAHSAAFGILQMATGKRIARSNALMMVHAPHINGPDNTDTKYAIDFESKFYEDLLIKRCKFPNEWMPLNVTMRFMNSLEALKFNAIDEISDK